MENMQLDKYKLPTLRKNGYVVDPVTKIDPSVRT